MISSMTYLCLASFLFINYFKLVYSRDCPYYDSNRELSFFRCGIYEYCCGIRCCRSPAITFYQMWYFWLMVFLTILFCSGGGWWYRIRNQDAFLTPSMPPRVSQARPVIYPERGSRTYPTTMQPPPPPMPNMSCPPPPYYGPPPSYDAVVNQSQTVNLAPQPPPPPPLSQPRQN